MEFSAYTDTQKNNEDLSNSIFSSTVVAIASLYMFIGLTSCGL